jgi:hypothetical protein
MKVLSKSTYEVKVNSSGKIFLRSFKNIAPWRLQSAMSQDLPVASGEEIPPNPPTTESSPASTEPYTKGDIIAVKDNASADVYWLAEVEEVRGTHLRLWYYGTHGRSLPTATFRHLYSTQANDLSFSATETKWGGDTSAHALPSTVLARNLKLTSSGRLALPVHSVGTEPKADVQWTSSAEFTSSDPVALPILNARSSG